MDLFGLISTVSFKGKKYSLVIVDYHSRFTLKYETNSQLIKFFNLVENENGEKIKAIRSDHRGEFDFF